MFKKIEVMSRNTEIKTEKTANEVVNATVVNKTHVDSAMTPALQKSTIELQVIDLTASIPDLEMAQEVPFDLMADYWTPEAKGESKRVYFDCIKEREIRDIQDPNVTATLRCAYFFEKEKGQPVKTISNGSKRLVGVIEDMKIQRGTPLLITYQGKKKNATNTFSSDNWSIKPLLIKL